MQTLQWPRLGRRCKKPFHKNKNPDAGAGDSLVRHPPRATKILTLSEDE